jgi:hypothetical protein
LACTPPRRPSNSRLVGLQPAELLGGLRTGDLHPRLGDTEAIHDLLEHLDIAVDLLGQPDEEVLVRGADVLLGEPVGEVRAHRRAGAVVLQVCLEVVRRRRGHALWLPDRPARYAMRSVRRDRYGPEPCD